MLKKECGISLEMLLWKKASSRIEGRISWFFLSPGRKLGVLLEFLQGPQDPTCVALEIQCPCELRGACQDSSPVGAGS